MKAPAGQQGEAIDTAPLRRAIRDGQKLRLRYLSAAGEESERTVAPVVIGFAEASTLLIAWCDLRDGFRHFRIERIVEVQVLDEPTGSRPGELRRRWQQWRAQQLAQSLPTLR